MNEYISLNKHLHNQDIFLRDQFALDILMGFSSPTKFISSKYFYDDLGSRFFNQIADSPEYYLTACEFEILRSYKQDIAKQLGPGEFNLIELGAGDGRKTKVLIEEFLRSGHKFEYLPIDISESAIFYLSEEFGTEHQDLSFFGIISEYEEGLRWIKENRDGRSFVCFLGSNIGNFDHVNSLAFLRSIWNTLKDGDLMLIGFDLKKDIDILLSAYNDIEGITKEFNLNLLTRINKELGGEFDLSKFDHFGTYNPKVGAMESYLISLSDQTVYIKELQKHFHFQEYEPIHLEYSYKYLQSDVETLAKSTGFKVIDNLYDSQKYFCDSLWQVIKH